MPNADIGGDNYIVAMQRLMEKRLSSLVIIWSKKCDRPATDGGRNSRRNLKKTLYLQLCALIQLLAVCCVDMLINVHFIFYLKLFVQKNRSLLYAIHINKYM